MDPVDPIAHARLLWHTVRHLRAQQVLNRIARRFRRIWIDESPAPPRAPVTGAWRRCRRESSMTGRQSFAFLSETHTVESTPDWHNPAWPRLWLYNLHYFDDLVSDLADTHRDWHRELVARWLKENPPAAGTGWEPYPLSLRLVNWIKWSLAGEPFPIRMLDSLALQARCLAQQLEYHLLGNHLWANAKALIFAGCYFSGPEANRWRATGERILSEQWTEQILSDGGHFERSPMYHAIALEDALDLLQLAQRFPSALALGLVASLEAVAPAMWRWLAVMSHPDGELSLFNDAAIGIAPNCAVLADYASGIGVAVDRSPLRAVEHLAASGYVRLSRGGAAVLVDVGPIGPDHLPGHAHADTLSLEFSLHGRRILANGGTSTYAPGPMRAAQRGTAMQNTVVVDGHDSSEVWSSFRVGRRARLLSVIVEECDGRLRVKASHDGYRRLPGKPVHVRTVTLDSGELNIEDRIEGRAKSAVAHFRFAHPIAVVSGSADGAWRLSVDAVEIDVEVTSETLVLHDGTWHPRFGVSLPVRIGLAPVGAAGLHTRFRWR